MPDQETSPLHSEIMSDELLPEKSHDHRRQVAIKALVLLVVFIIGGGSGFLIGERIGHRMATSKDDMSAGEAMSLMRQINPTDGYVIPVVFGDVGPDLVVAGAINMPRFSSLYEQQEKPLTDEQVTILTNETQAKVEINSDNAYFLLNFFWALGLTNQNTILTQGAMVSRGLGQVSSFASTGGWTLGTKPATELFASRKIVELTVEQQARLQEVAAMVYRPCCNNPTDFPDCNHGMAMLGLLELMASQNATIEQMYDAAKYVNAFWYPQQMLEVATAIKTTQNVDFVKVDAKVVVSSQYSSASGYQAVHEWLVSKGLLQQAPGNGGSCGVG